MKTDICLILASIPPLCLTTHKTPSTIFFVHASSGLCLRGRCHSNVGSILGIILFLVTDRLVRSFLLRSRLWCQRTKPFHSNRCVMAAFDSAQFYLNWIHVLKCIILYYITLPLSTLSHTEIGTWCYIALMCKNQTLFWAKCTMIISAGVKVIKLHSRIQNWRCSICTITYVEGSDSQSSQSIRYTKEGTQRLWIEQRDNHVDLQHGEAW